MQVRILAVCVLMLAALSGVTRSITSWSGAIFISNAKYLQNERNPAAIRKVFDYSQFDGEPLKVRSLKRLVNDARVLTDETRVGIELGHFVTKGSDGRGQFACDYYGRVQLTFEGEGILEFGEKPIMQVEAPCTISADINRIETIWIPFARLMNDNRVPARFIETSYPEQGTVHFRFDQMTSQWPRQWTLVSVRLFSATEKGREVSISKTELVEVAEKPVTIHF